MNRPNMHWRVSPVAWLPISLAIVAEAVSNALRAYGLGMHLDRFTVHMHGHPVSIAGAVLVLAAVAVSLSQARAAWVALTPGSARQRIVAGAAAALLLAISVSAMASHILEAQRAKTGAEGNDRTAYTIAKGDYDRAKAEHDRLAAMRSTEEVRAAMDKTRVPAWAWRDTKQCTADAANMGADQAKACKPILDLRVEMAQAITKAGAAQAMRAAERKLSSLNPAAEASAEEALVSRWWAWIMGLGVVFVATFGTVIFATVTPAPAGSSDATVRALPAPVPTSSGSSGSSGSSATDFVAEAANIRPDNGPDDAPDGRGGEPATPPDGPANTPAQRRSPDSADACGHPKRSAAVERLLADIQAGRTFDSQAAIVREYGVPRSTLSDQLAAWESAGLIPHRRTIGRCKAIA